VTENRSHKTSGKAALVPLVAGGLFSLLHSSAIAQPHQRLSVVRDGRTVYLSEENARLFLISEAGWRGPSDVTLGDGTVISLRLADRRSNDAVFYRNGKERGRLPLRDLLQKRLDEEHKWGGDGEANGLRDMDEKKGVGLSLINLVPLKSSALAVLCLSALRPSGEPLIEQYLVRLEAAPKPNTTLLRRLEVPVDWLGPLSSDPVPRLLRWADRLLLYPEAAVPPWVSSKPDTKLRPLEEITAHGKTVRTVARLPGRLYPVGVVDSRWLLLGIPDEKEETPLWLYDLQARTLKPLPGAWKGYFSSGYIHVPATGRRILIHTPGSRRTFIVTVPSGRRISVPNPTGSVMAHLWRGKAVILSGENEVSIYREDNGKLIRRMAVPPELPSKPGQR
jgi:hypothetical protein